MATKPTGIVAKLRIQLWANGVLVAEGSDPVLWSRILDTLRITPPEEAEPPPADVPSPLPTADCLLPTGAKP